MKKLLSLLLSIVMLFTVAAPAMTVGAQGGFITIYITGFSGSLYKNNVKSEENRIYPPEVDIGAILDSALEPLLQDLIAGMITDDYDEYCDELYNAVAPIFADLKLDENGEASDGSGWGGNMLTDSYNIERGGTYPDGRITFHYDWRLSIEHNAKILEAFIDRVCREQGVSKVNLLGRCMGGNLISAYLENGSNLEKVNDVVMYIPSTMGMNFLGALFSGEITLNDETLNNFVNYYTTEKTIISDPVINDLVGSLVAFFKEITVLGIGVDAFQGLVDNVKDDLVGRLALASFGSFPSFWAMVPPKYYEKARDYIFCTDELKATYAELIKKTDSYYNNVQLNAYDTMTELQEDGMRFLVIAKYNVPLIPLAPESAQQGDFFTETSYLSFGATCADYNKELSDSYINSLGDEQKKYLSPDRKIDASTCLFPDTTWFLKNCHHNYFPDSVDRLINAFYNDDNMTVFTYEEYPQFLEFYGQTESEASGEIRPVEGPDKPVPEPQTNESRFAAFIRFFTAIFNFIANLFKR